MAKHDERFKLLVVRSYLAGRDGGFHSVGRLYGVSASQVRRWVSHYRQHGRKGLIKKYSTYDVPFKVAVLKRMWRDGLSLQQVAALFDIRHPAHVHKWEGQYHSGGVDALASKPRGRPKRMTNPEPPKPPPPEGQDTRTLDELRRENAYLRAEVAYLKKLDALVRAKKPPAKRKR